ncbi:hypothetical protein JCM10296v2_006558 [Rhodotorula toruloides]
MFALCLDWNYVGSGGGSLGALFTPFTTQVSQYIGVALCVIIFCGMYATNAWNASVFPFLSQDLFFANGSQYDQLLILNADYSPNETALEIYGVPWYAASNAIYYLDCNLAMGATLTHVAIWYWRPIKDAMHGFRCHPLPWWALIVAILLAFFMFPFVCVIYAITGSKTDVQQLAQMLGAALVPGNSQADM